MLRTCLRKSQHVRHGELCSGGCMRSPQSILRQDAPHGTSLRGQIMRPDYAVWPNSPFVPPSFAAKFRIWLRGQTVQRGRYSTAKHVCSAARVNQISRVRRVTKKYCSCALFMTVAGAFPINFFVWQAASKSPFYFSHAL